MSCRPNLRRRIRGIPLSPRPPDGLTYGRARQMNKVQPSSSPRFGSHQPNMSNNARTWTSGPPPARTAKPKQSWIEASWFESFFSIGAKPGGFFVRQLMRTFACTEQHRMAAPTCTRTNFCTAYHDVQRSSFEINLLRRLA